MTSTTDKILSWVIGIVVVIAVGVTVGGIGFDLLVRDEALPHELYIETRLHPQDRPQPILSCMDMDVVITTVDRSNVRVNMRGEAILCPDEHGGWLITSTYGPSIKAARESGTEIILKPWDGPVVDLD